MIKGILPALITPINEKGELNVEALNKLINDMILNGADGFYLCGATGEGLNLSASLHKQMAKEAIKAIDERVPAIVHVARLNFDEAIELAKYAESVGASAISAIPPIFYRYNLDELYDYYKILSESVSIPLVIYNNPSAGVTFSKDMLKRLFSLPNVKAIKWTNNDYATVMATKAEIPDANFINGPDQMLLMGLTAGCDAGIGTTYNFLLPEIKGIYNAYVSGDIKEANRLQSYVARVCSAMSGRNLIMATKFIVSRFGYDVYHPIAPMRKFTEAEEKALIESLRSVGMDIN